MTHSTLWLTPTAHATRPLLASDIETEVCIIGAGIAGLTTAYLLAKSGMQVIVLEADEPGAGETGRTSAHLASALDDRFHWLERVHGTQGARLAAESHAAAIDFIEHFSTKHRIDCGFQRVSGYLFASDSAGLQELDDEEIAARRAGLDVTRTSSDGLPWFRSGPCLAFGRQAQFSPLAYLQGLAREAEAVGVRIFTNTRAADIRGGAQARVTTTGGFAVSCRNIVVCSNVPINDRVRLHTALEAWRSYVIGIPVPQGSLEPGLLWDTAEPYHYVRTLRRANADIVIVGGEDHKTGQGPTDPQQPYRKLEEWIRDRTMLREPVAYRWSGQIIEPVDGLALIGHNSFDAENVFVVSGDSGNGLTHGTLGAMIIADQIQGRKNPWEELYRPSRFRLGSAAEYAKHNVQVVGQYADWLRAADFGSIDEVPTGVAGLVRHGLAKTAVYRDSEGIAHVCSAICPHLGGLVRWNADEKTWDCPCHGSRFSIDGEILNGPSNTPLVRMEFPASAY